MAKIIDPSRVYNYVYLSKDTSVLTPILKKYFWNHLMVLVPRYMSANLLSFLANVGSVLGFAALVGLFGPMRELAAQNQLWYLIPTIGIFFYFNLDNIDGTQARRTGSSSPLGEFMDHWFDTFNSFMLPVGLVYAIGVNDTVLMVLGVCSVWAFWATMWEQRKTGMLIMGSVSQVEGMVLIILLHLASIIIGPGFYDIELISGITVIDALAVWVTTTYLFITLQIEFRMKEDHADILGVSATMGILAGWYYAGQYAGLAALTGSLMYPCIIGLAGCKHIGDNQRARLIGTQFKRFDLGFIALGLVAIGSVFYQPAFITMSSVDWQYTVGSVLFAYAGLKLLYQYVHTTTYITEKLGINVFSLTQEQKRKLDEADGPKNSGSSESASSPA